MLSTFTSAGWNFINETTNGTNDYWRLCVDGIDYPRLAWEFSNHGDFVCPDGVPTEDLTHFVSWWLSLNCANSNECAETDMNANGTVDLVDFAIFATHWLEGVGQ